MKPSLVLRIVPICGFLLVGVAIAQAQTAFVPDYFPVDRKTYCKRTFEWTFGQSGQVQSEIIGNITVPYTSGALSGSLICNLAPGDPDLSAWRNDRVTLKNLMDGSHYPSTDCLLTAYPAALGLGPVQDREHLVFADAYGFAIEKGLTWCYVGGDSNDVWWFRIQDVTLQGRVYSNALIVWNFDSPERPFVPLHLHGKDVALGITPPTAADAWNRAPDSFWILAPGVGVIAAAEINDYSGELVALGELVSVSCHEKAPVFDAFDIPGTRLTSAQGGNDSGSIVGHYADSRSVVHGFVRDRKGVLAAVDFPGAIATFARNINNRGDIVGVYLDTANVNHGFLFAKGVFTSIDVPDAAHTHALGINNRGDIVGFYRRDPGGPARGFLRASGGDFTEIDKPGAVGTQALGINDHGDIVGSYRDATKAVHGFLLKGGAFTIIDIPGAQTIEARGINAAGAIAGMYTEPGRPPRGFLFRGGVLETIDVPCARATVLHDITNQGDPIGDFKDHRDIVYGFSVSP